MRLGWLSIGLLLSVAPSAFAGTLCREKKTGTYLEYQSSGTPGTCEKNYVTENPQYGYQPGDIEELVITSNEWTTIHKPVWIDAPAKTKQEAEAAKREDALMALKTKLALSDTDLANLKLLVGD